MSTILCRISPVALGIALAFASSTALYGCSKSSNMSSEEHIQLAKDMQSQRNFKGSIIELKNAVQKDPDNAQARWLLGQTYLRLKLGESALKEFEKAKQLGVSASALQADMVEALLLKRDFSAVLNLVQIDNQTAVPQRAKAMQMRGDALLGSGKIDEACSLYTQAVEIDPKLAKAQIGLGTCSFVRGNTEAAQAYYQKAVSLDSHNPDHKLALASLAREQGNLATALQAYNLALKDEPANLDALTGKAHTLLALNRTKDAEETLNILRVNYPKHFMNGYMNALVAAHNSQFEKSRDLLQENLKLAPDHLESLFLLGSVQMQLNQLELAGQSLGIALKIAPSSSAVRTMLASLYLKRQQPKAAYDVLVPVLNGRPNFTQLGLAGEALMQIGRTSEANALFVEAAKLNPKSGVPALAMGRANLQMTKSSDALEFLQQASKFEQTSLQAELFMIRTLWQQGNRAEALDRLAAAEKKHASNVDLPLLRGSLLFKENNLALARMAFERVLAIESKNTRAILALGDLDIKEGRKEQSLKRLNNALKDNPNDEGLLLAAAMQNDKSGDRDKALELMEKAAKANPNSFLPQHFLVQSALDTGETKRALEIARSFSDRQPDSREAKLLLANTQFSAQDFSSAIAGYKKLLTDTPNDSAINLQLGLALLATNANKEAREAIGKSVAASKDAFAPLYALTNLETRSGNYTTALNLAKRLEQTYPQSDAGLTFQGDIAYKQGNHALALDFYQRALKVADSSQVVLKISNTLDRLNRANEAENRLGEWIKKHPSDAMVRQAYADRLGKRGNIGGALEHYEYLHKIQPKSIAILNNLSLLLASQYPSRALKLAQSANTLAPASPHVMDTYGWLLASNGRANEGLPLLEKAHSLLPREASIHFHYATVLAKSGNASEAKRELQKLLASHKAFPERQEAEALLRSL
jgi:putative PEP-CTERM system TPR-repeat lipoprotein